MNAFKAEIVPARNNGGLFPEMSGAKERHGRLCPWVTDFLRPWSLNGSHFCHSDLIIYLEFSVMDYIHGESTQN